MKRRGPRTEPWGTPVVTGEGSEEKDLSWINWVRSVRYEWNQRRGVWVMPIEESLWRRVRCEMVSNAALRSRRMRMESEPVSAAVRRSLVILIRAVSVLWRGRKPDWKGSYRLFRVRCAWSWEETIFSRILEMKGKLEIGRRLLKSLGSEPSFFRIGVTAAVLKAEGTIPVDSEEWIMAEMSGSREERQDLTRVVGIGSSRQVEGLDLWMRLDISEALGS